MPILLLCWPCSVPAKKLAKRRDLLNAVTNLLSELPNKIWDSSDNRDLLAELVVALQRSFSTPAAKAPRDGADKDAAKKHKSKKK